MTGSLQRRVQQSKPLSLEQEAFANLHRTYGYVMGEILSLLNQAELTPTQFNILRILRGAPAGLRIGEVAARLVSPDPDITRLLDRLNRRGWIGRSKDKQDRRATLVRITPKGLTKLEGVEGPVRAIQQKQFSTLGKQKLEQLIALLEELRGEKE